MQILDLCLCVCVGDDHRSVLASAGPGLCESQHVWAGSRHKGHSADIWPTPQLQAEVHFSTGKSIDSSRPKEVSQSEIKISIW